MIEQPTVSFNVSFLKESAKQLAESHANIASDDYYRLIKPILDESKVILNDAYRALSKLEKADQEISPAAEWLIDNFYIIQEQIVQTAFDFPKEYQKSIPSLSIGEYKGLPRVYEIVLNFLVHTDNLVDIDVLTQYIKSYQEIDTLKQGEIWAIPIMIRLILIQRLAEKASRIMYRKNVRQDVQQLLKKIEKKDTEEPGTVTNILSGWLNSKSENSIDPLIMIELFNQLQVSGMLFEEQKRWFNYRFKQHDMPLEEAMRIEAQKQSRLQVSIQNAVISLRDTSETDWSEFSEGCSIVDQILRLDPSGYYPEMDFQTRDSYRRTVERISRRSKHTETEVAEQVLLMTEDQSRETFQDPEDFLNNSNIIKQHVGYYLAGEGYAELAKKMGYSMPLKERLLQKLEKNTGYYISAITLHTLVLLVILWVATDTISRSPAMSLAMLLIALFPALDLSISAVNRFFAFFLPPRLLPKMDYEEQIPVNSRTMIVVPTMLSSTEDVHRQIENLEIRSLANPNSVLQFALLSDFTDAREKHLKGDQSILDTAMEAVRELNNKYSSDFGDKFFLLHRERLWNESEGVWMGWERKRGKLEEFNRLLCEPSAETSYTYIEGNFLDSVSSIPVRFVITLDSDTKLPPGSAKKMIRTIAHPLNRAWHDPEKRRITQGYGIVQPRISIPPESARKTFFSRIFSGNVGLDPYSTVVSDIYQDLAGEAVFTGKGIYDVQAFHDVLGQRFPENRILSHDLIESTYLRAGLATDIELFDEYPSTYVSFSKRNHRWARGDWQIAPWLFARVPAKEGKQNNTINLLSKWKIFDNLRRTLNPLALILFIAAGWFWLPGSAWIWTAAAFGILAFPIYVSLSSDILNRPARVRWKLYLDKIRANLKINSVQSVFTLIILPHQAVVYLDAILRTLYRMTISGKKLLEWTRASHTESVSPNSLNAYFRSMVFPVLLGTGILLAAFITAPHYLWIIIPFFLIWAGSPVYVWHISRPVMLRHMPYSEEDVQTLRTYARHTWFYFERFVNEEHFWLPPDNYQEDPPLPPAERTSPTNIGLALVSTQVAYNMGYITFGELLERQHNTLNSISKLERYKGHFYNWYETRLGEALSPRYVSTVDSGNLAAGLIVVKEAIKQEMNSRGINRKLWEGLSDTILSVKRIFEEFHAKGGYLPDSSYDRISFFTVSILEKLKNADARDVLQTVDLLRVLKEDASNLSATDLMPMGSRLGDQQMEDLLFWLESPLKQIEKAIAEYRCLLMSDGLDLNHFSPEELRIMINADGENRTCFQLVEKWKKQADEIISSCEDLIEEMDFSFLYIKKRGLFCIGYNVDKAQTDKGTYDLLASEARIASYIAIAKGDIPVEHWFRLSRRLTSLNQNEILLSWGGTMFEYLMPLLFMRSYPDTLISHTYDSVVRWHYDYGKLRNRPWGSSESAYNFLNIDMHYQYRAFGAPGLGLKRGLAEEYVVAPYASMLSLMIAPKLSLENLKKIKEAGGFGLHGFYDAIDYTPSRLSDPDKYKVVKTFMAHHHGMSLIAIENLLNGWTINKYFHSDPRIKGCELILQERIPRGVPIKEPHPIDVELEPGEQELLENIVEHAGINELDVSPPRLQILSNGKYSTIVSHSGTGSSRCNGLVLNRWEADPVTDPFGFFLYIKDVESGKYWSGMHQPVKQKPDRYDTWFHNGKVVTSRVDEWVETTTEICVSPDHAMEFRKITLTNYSDRERSLEITSYAEVVLNRMEDHQAHPAFSKLFIQTDYLPEHHSILVRRRPRNEGEKPLWMLHTFAGGETDDQTESLQFETERSNFVGRGRSLEHPAAMDKGYTLQGSLGNVSDPIVSLRKTVTLKGGEKKQFTFGLGFANSREEAIQLADMYDNQHATNRAFDLATVYSSVELNHIGISAREAHYFQKLASNVIYSDPRFRTDEERLRRNSKKQQDLWVYGISGDLPLVVIRIGDTDQLKYVKKLLKGHIFWRMKGLESELLILNDHAPGYVDEVQEAIQQSIESTMNREWMNKRGGVFLHRTDKMPEEDLTLLLSVAHVVFGKKLPDLSKQKTTSETSSWYEKNTREHYRPVEKRTQKEDGESFSGQEENLHFFNGYGGFSDAGDEYHIYTNPNRSTGLPDLPPAPWINVISNPEFGFIATERGAGYTWSENSRENKLTTWANDPVMDSHSEAFYIRDEESNVFWSPTPGPAPGNGVYKVVHGFGYSKYEHSLDELDQNLIQFVHRSKPVKISKLILKNNGMIKRKLSVFRYLEWVLGVDRVSSSRYVTQDSSGDGRIIYARNQYNNEFAGRTVFATVSGSIRDLHLRYTTDRKSFIGRNRSLNRPLAVCQDEFLGDKIKTGGDPCAAFQAVIELQPGVEISLFFLEGEARSEKEAKEIIQGFSEPDQVDAELQDVRKFWKNKLSAIRVETPEKSFDLMVNGWLMYQNLSSRMWARTSYYQAGGAFGFRDQLQDAMAALYIDPEITREQILIHASKQFKEGDVLHWWHPPTGRGIRSKITDDRLWLPYITEFYIRSTGDESILKEKVPYISARTLEEHEHEVYLIPEIMKDKGSVYEHCCKAIDVSLRFGKHGLPLIGAGDWNDGMNRVGEKGSGESVWLGFFLYTVLSKFEKTCRMMEDNKRADRYVKTAASLKKNLNKNGWDGDWYLRAFYDDGTPLGSSTNDECRIDAISQAWSVISGVASKTRGMKALASAEKYLISEQDQIIRLLTPPFDKTDKNPGYIKGYIPGVRENGGQYTHGALWVIKALAQMGEGRKALKYLNMINPVNHALSMNKADLYKVEPYVVAADIYGEAPLTGMGGWTWYTGSGGWMYRVALESIMGFQLQNRSIILKPAISTEWDKYTIRIRLDDNVTSYQITVHNPERVEYDVIEGTVDDKEVRFEKGFVRINTKKDGKDHIVNLHLYSTSEIQS